MESPKASGSLPENHLLYAPGLKWRARVGGDVPYWVPPQKDIKQGYAPKSLTLDRDASQLDIAAACRTQWADLEKWRKDKNATKPVKFTIAWLIGRYLNDPLSPFNKLTPDTQQSYRWECNRIQATIGMRRLDPKLKDGVLVPAIVGEDVRKWHYNWGHPAGKDPTPSRARHCMAMLRTLFSYNVEIGTPGCVELRARLSAMRFDVASARTMAPTYAQVDAFVNKAMEMGFRSIAITTLAQYELIERRAHIVGKWNGDVWGHGWVWEGVSPEWVISYYQTKRGLVLRQFDLRAVQRLLGLMQETPRELRKGPIILCEDTGEPWIKRRYQETFREIARAAGVPDEVYSMDMRAGGVTEADSIPDMTPRLIQDGAGHSDINTQEIYRRDRQRNANKVVVLRQAQRDKQ